MYIKKKSNINSEQSKTRRGVRPNLKMLPTSNKRPRVTSPNKNRDEFPPLRKPYGGPFQHDREFDKQLDKILGTKKISPAPNKVPRRIKKTKQTVTDENGAIWTIPNPSPSSSRPPSPNESDMEEDGYSTTNHYSPLNTDTQVDETNQDPKAIPKFNKPKVIKPTPIHVYNSNVNDLSQLLLTNEIVKNTFSLKGYNNLSTSIQAKDNAIYKKCIEIFKKNNVQIFLIYSKK